MEVLDYKEIKKLLIELKNMLDQFGDDSTKNQYRIISSSIEIIDSDISDGEKYVTIIRNYKNLYPARGGLSEFNIWRDDFEDRKKVNEPLDAIRKALWDIFKNY